MLDQRKYDSRVASSKSFRSGWQFGPSVDGSTWNRKCGDTSTACRASRMPASASSPFLLGGLDEAQQPGQFVVGHGPAKGAVGEGPDDS